MRGAGPVPLSELLGSRARASGLEALLAQAALLGRLQRAVEERLPPDLRPHCRVANLRDGVLVLQADSPSWATRLRYLAPELLTGLRSCGDALAAREVRVRVSPPRCTAPAPAARPALSRRTVELLRQLAELSEPPLRAAWLRLAGSGR